MSQKDAGHGAADHSTEVAGCCESGLNLEVRELVASNNDATFHIASMDCAAEESEIRRALTPIEGLRGLRYGLNNLPNRRDLAA